MKCKQTNQNWWRKPRSNFDSIKQTSICLRASCAAVAASLGDLPDAFAALCTPLYTLEWSVTPETYRNRNKVRSSEGSKVREETIQVR